MPTRKTHGRAVSGVRVDPKPDALRAVYLVEVRSYSETVEIARLFSELASLVQVQPLCTGTLVSYAVQADRADAAVLDEIETILKDNYSFVVTQGSFDEVIYRIVVELCRDTGSELVPIPRCDRCGKVDPFPATFLNLTGPSGEELESRAYCSSCTVEAAVPSKRALVRSLLELERPRKRRVGLRVAAAG